MARPGTTTQSPPWLGPSLLLGQLLLIHQVAAQWPPQGGFWSPASGNFFDNLNRGILPGGVKLSSLGGFPGTTGTGLGLPQQGAGRSNEIDCGIEPDPGPCNNQQNRYYYDPRSARCLTFQYGGCLGNPNRYNTEKECLARCKRPQTAGGATQQDPCRMPVDQGPCRGRLERFFFNTNTGQCEMFIFGGCRGNKNNFRDLGSCNQACRGGGQQGPGPQGQGPQDQGPQGQGPQDQGPQGQGPQGQGPQGQGPQGQGPQGQGPQGQGPQGQGPQGQGPQGQGPQGPGPQGQGPQGQGQQDSDLCSLLPVAGTCRDRLRRYFYNQESGTCQDFTYSGCEGNDNNFEDERSCYDRCGTDRGRQEAPDNRQQETEQPNNGAPSEGNVCALPPVRGRCRGNMIRFYYDTNARICRDFSYSGCDGNDNNFNRLADCERACGQDDTPKQRPSPNGGDGQNICLQPPVRGKCGGNLVRYYFDPRLGRCTDFNYGGCDANANNFETIESCARQCMPAPPTEKRPEDRSDDRNRQPETADICTLPPHKGPCTESQARLYFDSNAGECRNFVYGGCQGNKNNFEDLQACEERCKPAPASQLPHATQPPQNPDMRGGQSSDICTLPPAKGCCQRNLVRFFFDTTSGQCRSFTYGGCDGNSNNFENIESCKARCTQAPPAVTATPVPDICFLSPAVGRCRARLPRFYYDPRAGACRPFTYSGCQGNGNNFNDVNDCEARCKPVPPTAAAPPSMEEVCSLPSKTGLCRARFPRFFYDKEQGQCKEFIYGGCGGNANNFKDVNSCEAKCKGKSEEKRHHDCISPSDAGRCLAFFRRFFFNRDTGKCEAFVYGGCQGNSNNYKTKQECEKACKPHEAPKPKEEKLIECPAPMGVAACVQMCRSDSNCGEGQKCCSNGCGRLCIRDPPKKSP